MLEFLLVLYVVSGIIKSFLIFYGIILPIDLTLVSLILIFLYILLTRNFKLSLEHNHVLIIIVLLLFYTWMIFSLLHSPSPVYKYEKVFLFLTNLIAFLIPIFINKIDVLKFLKFLLILVLTFSFIYLPYHFLYYNDSLTKDFTAIKGHYLFLGQFVGLSIVIIATKPFGQYLWNRITDNILFATFFLLLLLMGSRGPLIFSFFTIFLYYIIARKKLPKVRLSFSRNSIVKSGIVILFIILLFYYKIDIIIVSIERTFYRFSLFFSGLSNSGGDFGDSVNIRLEQIIFSIKIIFENISNFFIGTGIGSFGLLYEGVDKRLYPHNIFIEAWIELGLIGFSLFCLFFFLVLKNRKSLYYLSFAPLLYIILNSMKTGSIVDMRLLFLVSAIFICKHNTVWKTSEQLKLNV